MDIGEDTKRHTFEPFPETEPIAEPTVEPVEVPERELEPA